MRWLLPLVAACGSSPVQRDALVEIDAAPDAMTGELETYQRRIVGALAGAEDVAPGVRLAHRASVAERDLARQFLIDELIALGIPVQRHNYTTPNFGAGANVIARLEPQAGTGATIVVGAHFDSVPAGPGAADNATGVAIVLAVAKHLRDIPDRKFPVVFALFDQEEIGLVGSKQWVASLAGEDIHGAHVYDMLSFDGDGDRAVELWSPSASLQAVYQLHGAAEGMPISAVTFRYSDHQAFLDAGFPATGVGEEFVAMDHTPHYHKATDTFENVSFEHLARVTRLAIRVLDDEAH